jgi:hypothetical protein
MNNKKEAVIKLKELLNEIPRLKQFNGYNNDYCRWKDNVKDTLENYFSKTSDEYKRFNVSKWVINHNIPEKQRYIQDLEADERRIKSIIDRENIIKISIFKDSTKWLKSIFQKICHILEHLWQVTVKAAFEGIINGLKKP